VVRLRGAHLLDVPGTDRRRAAMHQAQDLYWWTNAEAGSTARAAIKPNYRSQREASNWRVLVHHCAYHSSRPFMLTGRGVTRSLNECDVGAGAAGPLSGRRWRMSANGGGLKRSVANNGYRSNFDCPCSPLWPRSEKTDSPNMGYWNLGHRNML